MYFSCWLNKKTTKVGKDDCLQDRNSHQPNFAMHSTPVKQLDAAIAPIPVEGCLFKECLKMYYLFKIKLKNNPNNLYHFNLTKNTKWQKSHKLLVVLTFTYILLNYYLYYIYKYFKVHTYCCTLML